MHKPPEHPFGNLQKCNFNKVVIGTDDFSQYHLLSAAAMLAVLLLLFMCLAQIPSNRSSLWFLKGLMSCWLQPGWWKLNALKHGLL